MKKTVVSPGSLKNVDPNCPIGGAAITGLVMAEINKRPHLRDAFLSVQWHKGRGLGVETINAGGMEHLSNALGLPTAYNYITLPNRQSGQGREGTVLGHNVIVWHKEP